MIQYKEKKADTIENLVHQMWLSIYHRPTRIRYDSGNEFLSYAFKNYLIKDNYGIKP